jgi:hypothetical protein
VPTVWPSTPVNCFAKNLGCAHRMAIHPWSKFAKYVGWAHRVAIHPCFKLQCVWDEPTVWPSPLVKYIAKDLNVPTVWPSTLVRCFANLGCAHRMAIHACSEVAKYLGWAHRMAIHPYFILPGVWDEPTVWPSTLVHYFARSLGCAHRMAIHPWSDVARYLGWAHCMAIHP